MTAPWSGNNPDSIMSTITYTFSQPVSSVTFLILGTGVGTVIASESFTFTTNTVIPTVTVDPGTCWPWTINGNTTTNPPLLQAFNSYQSVFTTIPFTSVSIATYGISTNGGSQFELCSSGVVTWDAQELNFLGPDTELCPGDTLQLQTTVPGTTCTWQGGSTGQTLDVTGAGTYWADLYLGGVYIGVDTIRVSLAPVPVVDLGPDTTICAGAHFVLDPGPIDGNWLWSTGSDSAVFSVSPPQEVWLAVTRHGCTGVDTILVELADCTTSTILPNVFSPNADGVNDRFLPDPEWELDPFLLTVTNRYGNVVCTTNSQAGGWDGRTNDHRTCSAGTYFWTIQGRSPDGLERRLSGVVMLLR